MVAYYYMILYLSRKGTLFIGSVEAPPDERSSPPTSTHTEMYAREENTPVHGDASCPQRSELRAVLVTKRSSTGHASDQYW